jgi:hypothetical protein
MVDLLQQPQSQSDLDAEALFREARRRGRRRRIAGALLAAAILGAGIGLGFGLTSNSTPPSARGSHAQAVSASVLTDRQFLYTTYRAGFLLPSSQGSVVAATIQMWSNTSSQDCFVATYDGSPPQHSTCQNQNPFLGSGGQLGVGVMNVSPLPTRPAALLRDIVTTRTGNAALDQSLDQAAPVSEPKGGPKYDRAFERASLLLIGPTTGASPAFRTALLAVLPRLPGSDRSARSLHSPAQRVSDSQVPRWSGRRRSSSIQRAGCCSKSATPTTQSSTVRGLGTWCNGSIRSAPPWSLIEALCLPVCSTAHHPTNKSMPS